MEASRSPLQQHRKPDDKSARLALAVSSFAILMVNSALFAQTVVTSRPADATNDRPVITLRDATPIHLRFAERVCGAAPGLKDITAKHGAVVRLVVTRDLRVGDKVVITKGALAEASVERVLPPKPDHRRRPHDPIFPGVSLQMDWVTLVTGDRTTLRGTRNGPARGVEYYVDLSDTGADVKPMLLSKGVSGFLWRSESIFTAVPTPFNHEKPEDVCIPDSARIVAYLDGDLRLRAEEIEKAQATLPAPSNDAILYVFRLKEKKKESDIAPPLICNQIDVGALAPQQMTVTNLPPGNYSCSIGSQPPIQIGVQRGMEYYAQLHRSRHDAWILQWFNPEQGEDLSAETEVIPAKPTLNSQH